MTDRRYGTRRWRKVRLQVLTRDQWRCRIVTDCSERASVADHITPVVPDMPDGMFFGLANLRAGCREHNLARAQADKLVPKAVESTDVVTRDYSR